MSRCKAVIHWSTGDVTRCSQMLMDDDAKYCEHHRKYFEREDYFPAPELWPTRVPENQFGINPYVTGISDPIGKEMVTFDYSATGRRKGDV